MSSSFSRELDNYGPQAAAPPLTPREAEKYCRRFARRHEENFTVASLLLPRRLRRHFYNVYAYCRWADDLADETGDPEKSLALLDWWETQLRACYQGRAVHPVFIALGETIARFQIPIEPLMDLLVAFRQDQRVTRYETIEQLLEYCRYSAHPVGRLVLYLGECFSAEGARLSDSICTGLQLANFCQDVARDWQRGRIYLPQVDCRHYGYPEAMFERRESNEAFRALLRAEVDRAEGFLRAGLPLMKLLPPPLKLEGSLFLHGGLAILKAVRKQDYDVWSRRPTVTGVRKLALFFRCWWRLKVGSLPAEGYPADSPETRNHRK